MACSIAWRVALQQQRQANRKPLPCMSSLARLMRIALCLFACRAAPRMLPVIVTPRTRALWRTACMLRRTQNAARSSATTAPALFTAHLPPAFCNNRAYPICVLVASARSPVLRRLLGWRCARAHAHLPPPPPPARFTRAGAARLPPATNARPRVCAAASAAAPPREDGVVLAVMAIGRDGDSCWEGPSLL